MTDCDIKAFRKFFPNIGSFVIERKSGKAHADENFCRILNIPYRSERSEQELNAIIADIAYVPCLNMDNVYRKKIGAEEKFLRLLMEDREDGASGFLQDISDQAHSRALSSDVMRNKFLARVQDYINESKNTAYMATIHIIARHAKGAAGERCIANAAETLLEFASDDVFIGVKTYKALWVFIKNKTAEQTVELIKKMMLAAEAQSRPDVTISIKAGYCEYPMQGVSADELLVKADFAAYEAVRGAAGSCKRFNEGSFESKRRDFAEISAFNKVVDENLLVYHFQPVVSAKNGDIIGYEALMRATDGSLSPADIIRIAENQNRLYDIERLTFSNVMKFYSCNEGLFKGRKVLINSITSSMLTDKDFDSIASAYGELFRSTIWEITEQTKPTDEVLDTIKSRAKRFNCAIAIDDYGSGYANTNNLLKIFPNIVKIDAELIRDIDTNNHKQHFVSGIIYFCTVNGIRVLAEGVETSGELNWVIKAGIDYIQGYYVCRPQPVVVDAVESSVRDEIVRTAAGV